MNKESNQPKCWVITEGIAGTENQSVGVAEYLKWQTEVKRIELSEPWKSLSPYLGFERRSSFTPRLIPPWPDILIAGGRKSIAASRYIKKQNPHCYTVYIQDPRISSKHFDLVAVPKHDPMRGDNVIVTDASPNHITQNRLSDAKVQFPFLHDLPHPRVAVLIGGNSKAYTITPEICETLAEQLNTLNASLMITCSRRTPEDCQNILKEQLTSSTNYFWDGTNENPYFALLGWADFILVTADSASMISESCTTGKPTYMIPLEGGAKRICALQNHLIHDGKLRIFNGALEKYDYEPLNDAQMVANEIKRRYSAFTQSAT